MPIEVVFALTGNVFQNSRALKQLQLFRQAGYHTHVVSFGHQASSSSLEDCTLHLYPYPDAHGPALFARIHKIVSRAVRALQAHVYHASDLYVLPALAAKARASKSHLVYDARERYPYVSSTVGRPWVRHFWQAVEGYFIGRADGVFTVSHSIAAHLAATYAISRPQVLYNIPPYQQVQRANRLRPQAQLSEEPVLILHQGQMRKDRGCLVLLEAMSTVRGGALIFMGHGPLLPVLKQRSAALGLSHCVRFLPPVPPNELLPITADADIGVTLLEDTCLNHRFALPNKLFEYLMAGVPVLGSDLPEVRHIIGSHQVGILTNAQSVSSVAHALQYMIDHPGKRAHWSSHTPSVFETFNWESASQGFKDTYKALLSVREPS